MVKVYSKFIVEKLVKRGRRIYLQFEEDFQLIPLDMDIINMEIDGECKIFENTLIDTLFQNSKNLKIRKYGIIFTI